MSNFLRPARLALLTLSALALGCSEEAQRDLERAALEKVGDLAAARMVSSGDSGADGQNHSRDFIDIPVEVRQLADNVWQARGVGNTHLITTSEGHVVYDTGLSTQAAKQRRLLLEAVPDLPVTHVVVSHSHADPQAAPRSGSSPAWSSSPTRSSKRSSAT